MGTKSPQTASIFVALTHKRIRSIVQPMIGATISGDGHGGVKAGAGVAFLIPLVGMSIYLGTNHRGKFVWGFGAAGASEL